MKTTYNPAIHHRRSIRLKGYDYSQAGLYFITLCVQNRVCLFGEIQNGKMILNDAGKTAHQYWTEIPQHFPHVILHHHIIMPNHVHGIIELSVGTENIETNDTVGVENFRPLNNGTELRAEDIRAEDISGINRAEDIRAENIPGINRAEYIRAEDIPGINRAEYIRAEDIQGINRAENIPPQRGTIGSIVKGFKIGVTKWFRETYPNEFPRHRVVWQRNYYEHIIRNEKAYQRISNYIVNNPIKWEEDTFK